MVGQRCAAETAFLHKYKSGSSTRGHRGETWRLRPAECREVPEVLTAGIDVPAPTLDFQVHRAMAVMDGLSTQLLTGQRWVLRDDARAILTRHLRDVQDAWQRGTTRQDCEFSSG